MIHSAQVQLRADLDAVTAVVSYLTVALDPVGDEWLSAERLVGEPEFLLAHVRATGAGRGAPDDAVAASLFVQGYAFRLGAATLAPLVVTGRGTVVAPAQAMIRITRNRPGAIALLSPVERAVELELVLHPLLEHVGAMVTTLRSVVRVGERMLWGNVLSSFVTVLRAIEGETSDVRERHRIRMFADNMAARVSAVHGPLGTFFVVSSGSVDTWQYQRTSCCLWYQSSECVKAGIAYCGDCSLLDINQRKTDLLAGLAVE